MGSLCGRGKERLGRSQGAERGLRLGLEDELAALRVVAAAEGRGDLALRTEQVARIIRLDPVDAEHVVHALALVVGENRDAIRLQMEAVAVKRHSTVTGHGDRDLVTSANRSHHLADEMRLGSGTKAQGVSLMKQLLDVDMRLHMKLVSIPLVRRDISLPV